MEVQSQAFLTSALEGQLHTSAASPGEGETAPPPSRTQRTEGYVDPRSSSGRFKEKIISGPSRDTNHNSSAVYPVAQSLYRARFLPKTIATVNSNSLFSLYEHQGDKQKPPTTLVRLTSFTIIYITVYIINRLSAQLNPICWHYYELTIFSTLAG
jgi:hypothetical protein